MCELSKHKRSTLISWVSKDGKHYDPKKYNAEKTKHLPPDEYPFKPYHKTDYLFKCCQICDCKSKIPLDS